MRPGRSRVKSLDALHDDVVSAVRRGQIARDIRDGSHAVHVGGGRLQSLAIALHENSDLAFLAHRLLDRSDRHRPPDGDREKDPRKQHSLPHGQDEERIRARSGGGWVFGGLSL
jgi:hypothetical protein